VERESTVIIEREFRCSMKNRNQVLSFTNDDDEEDEEVETLSLIARRGGGGGEGCVSEW